MTTWRDESRFNAEGAERFDWLAKWSFGRNFFSDLKRGFSQLGTWQKTVRNGLMITVLVIHVWELIAVGTAIYPKLLAP